MVREGSDDLQIGDEVVFRNAVGQLLPGYGIGKVLASDLSFVTVASPGMKEMKFNAGTLTADGVTIAKATEADYAEFAPPAPPPPAERCELCLWWRPPFVRSQKGNCHNTQVASMFSLREPQTFGTFGCRLWESVEKEPEETWA